MAKACIFYMIIGQLNTVAIRNNCLEEKWKWRKEMVKDSHAPKNKSNPPKKPAEQRNSKGKSNARGGRN